MTVLDLDQRTIEDTIAVLLYGRAPKGYIRTYAAGRVDYSLHAREAYSYGRHFPLFRYLPRQKRRPALFVINGDRWNGGARGWNRSRTPDHQDITRRAIERTGVPSIVLPFSALDGAGIDIDSIRPLDVQADRWETVTVERRRLDDVPRWRRTVTVRLEGPSRQYGYGAPTIEVPIEPDADGIYRWQEERHHLGAALFTAVRDGRRGRYLSSFDYNEPVPLYFLCEVPRSGFPSVDGALDSLAPRAVHAALLAGKEVQRQGDVFFIGTSLTRETLAARGAVFARHTQWTRNAKPRPGEIGYRAPVRTVTEWRRVRETNMRRRLFRETFARVQREAVTAHVPDPVQRAENRRLWADLRARHAAELAAVAAAGVDPTAEESSVCPVCGAAIGEPCRSLPDSVDVPARFRGRQCSGAGRYDITYRHARETETLKRETGAHRRPVAGPSSEPGARKRWRKIRADRAARITAATVALRRATLGTVPRGYGYGGRPWRSGAVQYRRWQNMQAVKAARQNLQRETAPPARYGAATNAQARDAYRNRYGANAIGAYNRAADAARVKYRPETVDGTNEQRARREAIRRHLMIYGTAHTATEVARIGPAVYVRGTVRHAVDLETNRRGGPDHRPLTLAPDVWYLAVRNTVPRQNRRPRRVTA